MRPVVELALFTDDLASLIAFYESVLGGAPAFPVRTYGSVSVGWSPHSDSSQESLTVLTMKLTQMVLQTRITLRSQ